MGVYVLTTLVYIKLHRIAMLFQSFSLPTLFTIPFSATKNNKLFGIKFYSTIYNKYITHAVKLREAGLAAPWVVTTTGFLLINCTQEP